MSSEIKTTSLDFGTVIAFVAPGFIGFYALSYHVPTARGWLDAASTKEQTIGVFLMVLLASIATGLVISGIRQLVIDKLMFSRFLWRWAVPKFKVDWSKISVATNLQLLITIRDGYYWYYQFYSNMLIAIVFWAAARLMAGRSFERSHWIVIAFAAVALFSSARYSLDRWATALKEADMVK